MCFSGNCFGETGVELVRESLEAKGHAEVLGSLSDDEGSGTDEEGSDGEEEEKKEEEEDEEVEKELNGDKTEEINASETKRVVSSCKFMRWPAYTRYCIYAFSSLGRCPLPTTKLPNTRTIMMMIVYC